MNWKNRWIMIVGNWDFLNTFFLKVVAKFMYNRRKLLLNFELLITENCVLLIYLYSIFFPYWESIKSSDIFWWCILSICMNLKYLNGTQCSVNTTNKLSSNEKITTSKNNNLSIIEQYYALFRILFIKCLRHSSI